jgi:hypothetical protein
MKKLAILGSVLLMALGLALAGAPSALASTVVHCPTDDLQAALNSAPAGSQIIIYGTCTGNFTVPTNVTLVGENAVLDGNHSGTVLTVNSGVTAEVDYLTIQNGSHEGIINRGTLTLKDATVSSNTTASTGGGIFNQLAVSTLTLKASTVSGNTARNDGGGIANNGGTVTVTSSTVSGNTANDVGGGIFNNGGPSTLTITGSTLYNNTARVNGGAVSNVGTTTITGSTVYDNTAGSDGGGIDIGNGTVSLTSSTVTNNTAATDGGGIFNAGTAALRGSSVSANTPNNCAPPGSVPGCTG